MVADVNKARSIDALEDNTRRLFHAQTTSNPAPQKHGLARLPDQSSQVGIWAYSLVGVRKMRFRLRFARLRAVGNELLEVQSDFCEERFQAASGACAARSQRPSCRLIVSIARVRLILYEDSGSR